MPDACDGYRLEKLWRWMRAVVNGQKPELE
jgi:hypothetical protein